MDYKLLKEIILEKFKLYVESEDYVRNSLFSQNKLDLYIEDDRLLVFHILYLEARIVKWGTGESLMNGYMLNEVKLYCNSDFLVDNKYLDMIYKVFIVEYGVLDKNLIHRFSGNLLDYTIEIDLSLYNLECDYVYFDDFNKFTLNKIRSNNISTLKNLKVKLPFSYSKNSYTDIKCEVLSELLNSFNGDIITLYQKSSLRAFDEIEDLCNFFKKYNIKNKNTIIVLDKGDMKIENILDEKNFSNLNFLYNSVCKLEFV